MEILVRDNYPKLAEEKGEYFMKKLREIDNDDIIEVRGKGLLIGVELKFRSRLCEEVHRCRRIGEREHTNAQSASHLPSSSPTSRSTTPWKESKAFAK